jgi:hypothetical protein
MRSYLFCILWLVLTLGCSSTSNTNPIRALELNKQFQSGAYLIRDVPPSNIIISYSPQTETQVFAWIVILAGLGFGISLFIVEKDGDDRAWAKLLSFVIPAGLGSLIGVALLTSKNETSINTDTSQFTYRSWGFGSSYEKTLPCSALQYYVSVSTSKNDNDETVIDGYSVHMREARFPDADGTELIEVENESDAFDLRNYLQNVCGSPTSQPQ